MDFDILGARRGEEHLPVYREPEEPEIRRFGFEFRTSATTADDNGFALQEENLPPSGLNCTVIGAWSIVWLIPLLQYLFSADRCPFCGSTDVGRSHRANRGEILLSWIRLWPLRCNDCSTRWMVLSWKDPKDSPD